MQALTLFTYFCSNTCCAKMEINIQTKRLVDCEDGVHYLENFQASDLWIDETALYDQVRIIPLCLSMLPCEIAWMLASLASVFLCIQLSLRRWSLDHCALWDHMIWHYYTHLLIEYCQFSSDSVFKLWLIHHSSTCAAQDKMDKTCCKCNYGCKGCWSNLHHGAIIVLGMILF
jgi:hypothetical protein